MEKEPPALSVRWKEILQKNPKLRIRDAAAQLGVSEAELLATQCGASVTRLEGNWKDLVKDFAKLGEVMCLTRNEAAVHERSGTFNEQISFFHGMGLVTGPEIDLRLFMDHWQFGFAVADDTEETPRRSLQFFSQDGKAVHKIYLTEKSEITVYDEFVRTFRADNQSSVQAVTPKEKSLPDRADSEIDVANFQASWLATTDTHDFFGLLKKFGVGRQQALRLAPPGHAHRVDLSATQNLLEAAASRKIPIMVFVASAGCIQIHTGPVENIKRLGGNWLNVLDEKFNFHLNETLVTSAWVVRKATKDGQVTSLELFDAAGENLTLFFGKRKPGEAEDPAWRALVAELPLLT